MIEVVDEAKKVEGKFISIMDAVGRDALKALADVQVYLLPVETLVETLFPGVTPVAAGIVNAAQLIQSAVVTIEQKYKAANLSGNGAQKSDDVLALATPTVTQLLEQEGVSGVDTWYIQNLVDAVVAVLKVQEAPPATA